MKKMAFWLIHLPDFICLYRIVASLLALWLGIHPLAPYLFTTALISDLLDGWIFRKYVKNHPAWRSWNPLPITLDPLADFTLLISGLIYACRYLYHLSPLGTTSVILLIGGISLTLNSLPFVVKPRNARLYTICMTLLTHCACALMVMSPLVAWYLSYPYPARYIGAFGTVCLFYGLFLYIGDFKRLIRRPPPDFFSGPSAHTH